MAKKQTRRSLSLAPQYYVALGKIAEADDAPMSATVQRLIEQEAKAKGIEIMSRRDAARVVLGKPLLRRGPQPDYAGHIFTF